ncbi:MAG TPA: DUF1573 domain-containing protein [Marinilabiliaceae bacterium]|nr:DUF1573 domain-containing protein [Marinilabiliaceae bacterium]
MKRIQVLFLIAALSIAAFAQNAKPVLSFEKKIHDFGDIKEGDGVISYVFEFINNGAQPLVVHNVRASCGCTTPDWTRQPVMPGGKGTVKVAFDPANRPGNFNKSITVSSNSETATEVLRVVGNVLQRDKTIEDIYPRAMGDIRLKSSHLSFTRVEPGATKNESMEIINTSSQPVTLTYNRVPKHITVKTVPATLKPGEEGVIQASFDASKLSDWGFVVDQMYLVLNGIQLQDGRMSVSATIEEDFSNWTPEKLANAPDIQFSETNFDFGTVKQGDELVHTFKINNVGKSNLILRKVKASCGCTATQPDKELVAPGEEANIKVTFNTRGRTGRQNKSITVYSNDPKKSTMLLRISATITN